MTTTLDYQRAVIAELPTTQLFQLAAAVNARHPNRCVPSTPWPGPPPAEALAVVDRCTLEQLDELVTLLAADDRFQRAGIVNGYTTFAEWRAHAPTLRAPSFIEAARGVQCCRPSVRRYWARWRDASVWTLLAGAVAFTVGLVVGLAWLMATAMPAAIGLVVLLFAACRLPARGLMCPGDHP